MLIQTCSLFRQLPEWEAHKTTFEDYKLNGIQPDFYGRDAELSYPHVHHIHLAQDEHVAKRWASINQVFYRTHRRGSPEEDYWLLYAFDDVLDSYLLLTIIGPAAHESKNWRSYLRSIYSDIVSPWIDGRLNDVI